MTNYAYKVSHRNITQHIKNTHSSQCEDDRSSSREIFRWATKDLNPKFKNLILVHAELTASKQLTEEMDMFKSNIHNYPKIAEIYTKCFDELHKANYIAVINEEDVIEGLKMFLPEIDENHFLIRHDLLSKIISRTFLINQTVIDLIINGYKETTIKRTVKRNKMSRAKSLSQYEDDKPLIEMTMKENNYAPVVKNIRVPHREILADTYRKVMSPKRQPEDSDSTSPVKVNIKTRKSNNGEIYKSNSLGNMADKTIYNGSAKPWTKFILEYEEQIDNDENRPERYTNYEP